MNTTLKTILLSIVTSAMVCGAIFYVGLERLKTFNREVSANLDLLKAKEEQEQRQWKEEKQKTASALYHAATNILQLCYLEITNLPPNMVIAKSMREALENGNINSKTLEISDHRLLETLGVKIDLLESKQHEAGMILGLAMTTMEQVKETKNFNLQMSLMKESKKGLQDYQSIENATYAVRREIAELTQKLLKSFPNNEPKAKTP